MKENSKGVLYAVAGTVLMSMDAVFVRLSGLKGWESSFLFGVFTFLSMTAFTAYKDKDGLINVIKSGGLMMILSGMVMGGSGNSFVLAVEATSVANVILIMAATPVFSALFSRILIGETTDKRTWIAIALCVAGIFIIVSGSLNTSGLKGDLLALLASGFVALNYVIWRKYPKMSRSMVVGFGGFFIAFFSSFSADMGSFTARGIMVMAVMGLFSAPIGRTLMSTSARYITAAQIGLYSLLKMAVTPAVVWAVFGEIPTTRTLTGGIIIFLSVFWHISASKGRSKA